MLENIKMILGIEDDSLDSKIEYYIKGIVQKILTFCNLKELPKELETFVENKVIKIMKVDIGNTLISSVVGVKSIKRGDTDIQLGTIEGKNTDELIELTDEERKELYSFRKLRW
ncbi:phage gp6-like head-tail connector protein [Gottschalkia purinilytica]|uniref:Phage gp6-like head-tail connector protein n=1 Tax=Gottschalkia purinilytica TaxID=1503 RepID=A0A0L0W7B1_GOTPU|nr:phage head-tail connector protein [Gottschalkia purinilytica]KNF07165.1 phage gp6-like head-tail connector protein [Gottschalkia purinilytica]